MRIWLFGYLNPTILLLGFFVVVIDVMLYSLFGGKPCMFTFQMRLPFCSGEGGGEAFKENGSVLVPKATVSLTPNPAGDAVTLTYGDLDGDSEVSLYDLSGRELGVYNLEGTTGALLLSTQNYPSGVYIVVVRNKKGIQAQKKLLIN